MCCTPLCPLHHHILKSSCLQRFLYQISEVILLFSTWTQLWGISRDNIYNLLSNHQSHIHDPLIDSDRIDNTANSSLSNKHTNTSSPLITALSKELVSSTNSSLKDNIIKSFFCVESPPPHQIDITYCSYSM